MRSRRERRLERTLADLADLIGEAKSFVERVGDLAHFLSDTTYMLAGEAITSRLGEIAVRLPEEFREAHAAISWGEIIGMRTIAAHDYDRVDHVIIWTSIVETFTEIAAKLRKELPAPKPLLPIAAHVITAPPALRRVGERNKVCGRWMPIARAFCALPPGHAGHCRSTA